MTRTFLYILVGAAIALPQIAFTQQPDDKSISRGLIPKVTTFNDTGWTILYQENFDTDYEASDGQTFGTDDWLTFQLLNGGAITVASGYAQLNAPDFWMAALIRSTDILPAEYKIRTKIGYINYDLTNYEQEDYDHPDFNDHQGHYENGMYFLTLTDRTCSGNQCAEEWWHYHRKMVIDVDNHINWDDPGETFHPVYMVYMAPEENSGGNLLRTWDGTQWDTSPWNWNVAYTYDYDTWYYAELEKRNEQIILRLYDESQNIIEETTPVSLELVNAMDDTLEYLYLGEPHTDDYEGDVRMDEITLLIPETPDFAHNPKVKIPSDHLITRNFPNPFNATTTIEYRLVENSHVTLEIFDILGRVVEMLIDTDQPVGNYKTVWDASAMPSGIYLYKLQAGDLIEAGEMLLLK